MPEVRLDNARDPEQLRRMEELVRNGQCHFCREGFTERHKAPIIYESDYWLITANNFPYTGSVHHYLIVPTQGHPTKISSLDSEAWIYLQVAIWWLEKYLGVSGESIFVRSGDMALTGATLDHLHFHFLVGQRKDTEPEENKNKTEPLWVVLGYKEKE